MSIRAQVRSAASGSFESPRAAFTGTSYEIVLTATDCPA
jgi:hypothetical protein